MKESSRLADLQRTFVAPSPLSQSRPRAVGLTATGRAVMTVACVLFAGAIGAGIALRHEAQRQAGNRYALISDGVITTGEVTRLWENNGDNRRRVVYRFVADGRSYTGDTRVSTERRRTLQVGSPLAVRYVPADPRVHDLGGTPRSGMPMWVPFLVAVGIAALAVLCLLVLDRQRRLLTDGRAAPAIVTAHQRNHSSHGTQRSMTFEFPLLSGAVASGKSGTSSKPPAVGSVICVVYDPDQPSRNVVYPMSLVRPVR